MDVKTKPRCWITHRFSTGCKFYNVPDFFTFVSLLSVLWIGCGGQNAGHDFLVEVGV